MTTSQQTFSSHDLLIVAVACEIEQRYGVKRPVLALIGEELRKTLTGPRVVNRDARLVVSFTPPTVTYLLPDTDVREGLVLPLGGLFAKVDEYLGVSGFGVDGDQTTLPLTPAVVRSHRGGGSHAR